MKKLTEKNLRNTSAGSNALAGIGGFTCAMMAIALASPFALAGVAMWGPTCFGSMIGIIVD
ncbi:hypothetical protein KUV50_06585 [Membranicola marinus]|uniref:Uncharacterized protein n=1 Tax=Membranihabitans marinus TaxID=1227546 RepID=A0A953HNG6_9BACT|nr:hypothetical protein [Membranihabitans marinus]MBY5957788.1 hypothetical protein [Membranihabitans marinus]